MKSTLNSVVIFLLLTQLIQILGMATSQNVLGFLKTIVSMGIVVTLKNRRYHRAGESSAKKNSDSNGSYCSFTIAGFDCRAWESREKCVVFLNFFCPFRCHRGYIGARCEYLDLDWLRGEKRDIIIFCIIGALILLILLIPKTLR